MTFRLVTGLNVTLHPSEVSEDNVVDQCLGLIRESGRDPRAAFTYDPEKSFVALHWNDGALQDFTVKRLEDTARMSPLEDLDFSSPREPSSTKGYRAVLTPPTYRMLINRTADELRVLRSLSQMRLRGLEADVAVVVPYIEGIGSPDFRNTLLALSNKTHRLYETGQNAARGYA